MDPHLQRSLWRKPADREEWISIAICSALVLAIVAIVLLVALTDSY